MTALPNLASARPFPIVIVGHIDHGKSTLIGRLLNDTGAIPRERVEAVKAASKRRGHDMEWAFLLDGFQAERDQGITIDSARIRFNSQKRTYTIIDAPGHREFLKNMITGAASAEAAVLVIDVAEGLAEQTKRHAHLLNLLGVRRLIVAVNKLDLVDGSQAAFDDIDRQIRDYLGGLDIVPEYVIPIAARAGHNVVTTSDLTLWYDGPTLVEALDGLPAPALAEHLPLRLPVQDVYDFVGTGPVIVGRVESGHLRPGDEVVFQPSGTAATVKALVGWDGNSGGDHAAAGRSVAITVDPGVDPPRGEVAMAAGAHVAPVETIEAAVFWFAAEPLRAGKRYTLKIHTARYDVTVDSVDNVVDSDSLVSARAAEIGEAAIGHVVLRCDTPMVIEAFATNRNLGRFVLLDGFDTVGGGIALRAGEAVENATAKSAANDDNIFRVAGLVPSADRVRAFGHQGAILWLTGLSGAGKSTVAYQLEQRLIERGQHAYVLDGDNLRHGISAGLGFSPDDRAEHNRRAGQVAALFADAGIIVIVALISPRRADRDGVRAINPDVFHEVFVDAPLEVCQQRDPKGLYVKALNGEIAEFTGITAPFERPENPELVLDTSSLTEQESVATLLDYVDTWLTRTSNAA